MQTAEDKPTLVFEWLEQEKIAIVCQSASPPLAGEWRAYMDFLRRLAAFEHRILIYTEIHLTRAQQAELTEATKSPFPPRVALVSPSTAVRFVATMFTLLNRNIRFFAPAQLEAALTFLAFNNGERARATRCYEQLMKQVCGRDSSLRAVAE